MTTVPTPIFTPHPAAVDALIHDLARPDFSFLDLAASLYTTPEALSLWMTRPSIRDRLAAAADLITWRTQFVATHSLTAALNTLTQVCTDFCRENADRRASRQPEPSTSASSDSARPIDPERAATLAARRAESARRAATTIIRLSTLRSIGAPTARPLSPSSPAPAADVSDRSKDRGGVPPVTPLTPQPSARRSEISDLKFSNPPFATTPLASVSSPKISNPKRPVPPFPSCPNPAPNRNPNRPLPSLPSLSSLSSLSPVSSVSSLLDLVGSSSSRTFSPRDPWS